MTIEVIEKSSGLPLTFLLVEDDNGDAKAFIRAFNNHEINNPIIRAVDGIEALDLLKGCNGTTKLTQPYVVISDINMPRMDGIKLIDKIRDDEDLKNSIIFMLTTSKSKGDIFLSYRQKVAGYVCKNNVGVDFCNLIRFFEKYWDIVELPKFQNT